jgi:hypothetical protein
VRSARAAALATMGLCAGGSTSFMPRYGYAMNADPCRMLIGMLAIVAASSCAAAAGRAPATIATVTVATPLPPGHDFLFNSDPVAVESAMNKRAVVDLAGRAYDERSREELMTVGRAILRVWSERIALLFGDRDVVFYLGGPRTTADSSLMPLCSQRVDN